MTVHFLSCGVPGSESRGEIPGFLPSPLSLRQIVDVNYAGYTTSVQRELTTGADTVYKAARENANKVKKRILK